MQNEQHEKRVRERAYALYLARNGQDGSEEQDWLRAEQELADTILVSKPVAAESPKPAASIKEASSSKEASPSTPVQNGRRRQSEPPSLRPARGPQGH